MMENKFKKIAVVGLLSFLIVALGVGYYNEIKKEKRILATIKNQLFNLNSYADLNVNEAIHAVKQVEKSNEDWGNREELSRFQNNLSTCQQEFTSFDRRVNRLLGNNADGIELNEKSKDSLMLNAQELIEKVELVTGASPISILSLEDKKRVKQKLEKLKLLLVNSKVLDYQGQKISFKEKSAFYLTLIRVEFSTFLREYTSLTKNGVDVYTLQFYKPIE